MLDFLACQSLEKLALDAEAIAMAKRFLEGMQVRTETLATALFEGVNFKGEFLKHRVTRQLFAKEQYLPSSIIDRDTIRGWQGSGKLDTFARAKDRVKLLLEEYQSPDHRPEQVQELHAMVKWLASEAGMEQLPDL
jgi:trimethylamine--corrinoid protein Co-methyltransferase